MGDEAVLLAPEGDFASELVRMDLGRPRFWAVPPEDAGGYSGQSLTAELADLRKALKQAKTPEEEISRIASEHANERRRLSEAITAQRAWKESHPQGVSEPEAADEAARVPRPGPVNVQVVAGLPGEFADYFEGFVAWHNPALAGEAAARAAWERLLARPEAERRYKSTWAAFMLGRSWEEAEPDKAIGYFKQVRELAGKGYKDSLGLAAASLGWEARVYLQRSNYLGALELYLDQMASGDPTADDSLAEVVGKALRAGPETLVALARNPRTQKVLTAYVMSRSRSDVVYGAPAEEGEPEPVKAVSAAASWLKAVEAAGVKDVDSAEALALAAYRANDMDCAARWVKRAANLPVAQWLQAKLWLRAGKLQSAAALLAKLSPQFPIIHEGTNAPAPVERKDSLVVGRDSAERRLQGELGVLWLARGEYRQALDALLNAGFWMDAAYVAERVLTLDELKAYVDRSWPAASAEQVAEERERFPSSPVCPALLREKIRYLLARRLTRELRGAEAREYYPEGWVGRFDLLVAELQAGWSESLPAPDRAAALFRAAMMTRTNGMELLGTEVAPDWHYHLGQYEDGVTGEDRSSNELAKVVRPLPDELLRNAGHNPEPNERFHYRYQAASLAWEAAKLLPDNTDQTAYVLWQGGSFLKGRDPDFADVFYKALVRRNRQTVLGQEADQQRWFPVIDENGNILPKVRKASLPPPEPEPQPSDPPEATQEPNPEPEGMSADSPVQAEPSQGYQYVVRSGDSVVTIARAFYKAGVLVTVRELMAANPGLQPGRLRVGQVIFVPAETQGANR